MVNKVFEQSIQSQKQLEALTTQIILIQWIYWWLLSHSILAVQIIIDYAAILQK